MKTKRIKIPFEKWHYSDLERIFGLVELENTPELKAWEAQKHPIPAEITGFLEKLRYELLRHERDWNETELMFKFIGPFLNFVSFSGKGYNSFADRPMKAVIGDYELSGRVDWVAASGVYEPLSPFFFLHEYKRFKAGDADPLGQLLSAMLAAQTHNGDEAPIYGCFVVGSIWKFVLLTQNSYCLSQGFDCTNPEELTHIWSMLVEIRAFIERRIANQNAV